MFKLTKIDVKPSTKHNVEGNKTKWKKEHPDYSKEYMKKYSITHPNYHKYYKQRIKDLMNKDIKIKELLEKEI